MPRQQPAESDPDGLSGLLAAIRACRICRDTLAKSPLPHEPRPVLRASATVRLLIAGQAPGTRVHASGVPFDDPSGDRLRDWLGLDRATFYDESRIAIVPMGFCFPGLDAKGGDLPPRRECAPAWRAAVLQAMPTVRLLLAIGAYAQRYHLGDQAAGGVTATVAGWREIADATRAANGRPVFPLPHPSWRNTGWLKRNPWFDTDLLPALRRAVAESLG